MGQREIFNYTNPLENKCQYELFDRIIASACAQNDFTNRSDDYVYESVGLAAFLHIVAHGTDSYRDILETVCKNIWREFKEDPIGKEVFSKSKFMKRVNDFIHARKLEDMDDIRSSTRRYEAEDEDESKGLGGERPLHDTCYNIEGILAISSNNPKNPKIKRAQKGLLILILINIPEHFCTYLKSIFTDDEPWF